MSKPWSTGLYSCMDDWESCCVGFWIPCHLYGQNAEQVGKNYWAHCFMQMLIPYFGCIYGANTRESIRNKYGLAEEPCGDCLVWFFCAYCAICQEARQLKGGM